MATILLSAVGASVGGGFGGAFLGLTGAVAGRAIGATVGRVIDQKLLGGGSRAVETGRIDRLRLPTAGEGQPIPRIWGQMRLPGHVIWATPLQEVRRTQGSGKGSPQPRVTEISYMLSVALALCEGVILGVGRVWADGEEIAATDLNMRVYHGDDMQMPDPAIAASEGDAAPAYRGTAYVVLENLALERWGNRMPQLTFEVTRAAQDGSGLQRDVQAVAMIPGTGEYALATTPVTYDFGLGETVSLNRNTPTGGTDFSASLDILGCELPNVGSVSLIVSWFGDDLRIGHCTVQPKVEHADLDGSEMPWRAGGITRAQATEVAQVDGRPIYGGTPSDQSVVEALRAIADSGRKAMFYPFILMEQIAGNGRPDPYGADEQAVMPWRGRVTTAIAPDREGSTDGTAAADAEVAAFLGRAQPGDFRREGDRIIYSGPEEWSYRRFILHYAHLCAASGGIDSFLIGSEMVAMTRIRGANGRYPAVEGLIRLARECREILGPDVKIGYASDWSEYFGHHLPGGDVRFHLDPLWADDAIDFVGIDNYMPLSDWRDGETHADAHWGRIDNPDYLRANVAGGEGFDWYYASDADRAAQIRTPIQDGAHGEDWIWRYKDLRGWWGNTHHERINGVRQQRPTAWEPGLKPIWFTEYGCAALDKATNQPNKFLDAMSSESVLPHYSNGRRNDALQAAYVQAFTSYWRDPANNPVRQGGGQMIDMSRAHVWCWDARPFPAFPARTDLWSDGPAWERGHWLNGRAGAVALSAVVADLCREAGVADFDTSGLSGVVRGYALQGGETGRAAMQPLMLAYGFDPVERDGKLSFVMRDGRVTADLGPDDMAIAGELAGPETARAPQSDISGRIRLTHIEAGGDYAVTTAETMLPDDDQGSVAESEFPMALTRGEGREVAERWLAESLAARDTLRFAVPPSWSSLGPGDIVRLRSDKGGTHRWRIDRVERAGAITVEAVRVDASSYAAPEAVSDSPAPVAFRPALPVWPLMLDLPLMNGDEMPHAPHLAVTATPWPGSVAAYISVGEDGGFDLNTTVLRRSIMGVTETDLPAARPGMTDRGPALRVRLKGGGLKSASHTGLLAGANLMAIGDGAPGRWELFQFLTARPVAPDVWEVSGRLRGQAGTDALMPAVWPAGSAVVLLDGAAQQLDLPPSVRGQMRHWRIGPTVRGPDDGSYRSLSAQVQGNGLRPLSPCHLRLQGGVLTWVRRTRIGGDGWDGLDVPLGESREAYLVRLTRNGQLLSETVTSLPRLIVPPELAGSGPFTAAVAQLSDEYGAGPFARRVFDVSE
ncbi:MAG: glycoside hydrolase/phage tail family protein [Paracoccus sp. (in: a-proteobacteria)]|uniref:baseplate multidomain protein megatron n=1 Tax=Paracoccus sp. TaxID=267 RepID=UPI0026E0646E|nr:glycoside hydrolase/phage tail family protein [Paracoccus sp. (in: a-proteobacteria)]MDO5630436.1 glycoside hydrolase/phage tail family protein [Paracoccus sp. (in: a-proteobacteria)]